MVAQQKYPSEKESRSLVVEIGKRLYQRGFVAANDGNISVKLSKDTILATPTGLSKGYMSADQLVIFDLVHNTWEGYLKPSTEIKMHRAIYIARSDVQAVVHAHPPIATAFSVAGIPLDKSILAEVIVSLGTIPIAGYQTPSTQEFADQIGSYVQQYDAVLLANHGAVTVGQDLTQAHFRMETLEHYAHISFITRQLGSENVLDFNQVRELFALRSMYGAAPPSNECLNCPNFPHESVEPIPEDKTFGKQSDAAGKQSDAAPPIDLVEDIVQSVIQKLQTRFRH